jgi:hypothetical protein
VSNSSTKNSVRGTAYIWPRPWAETERYQDYRAAILKAIHSLKIDFSVIDPTSRLGLTTLIVRAATEEEISRVASHELAGGLDRIIAIDLLSDCVDINEIADEVTYSGDRTLTHSERIEIARYGASHELEKGLMAYYLFGIYAILDA